MWNLEIVLKNCATLRLCKSFTQSQDWLQSLDWHTISRFWECATQSWDRMEHRYVHFIHMHSYISCIIIMVNSKSRVDQQTIKQSTALMATTRRERTHGPISSIITAMGSNPWQQRCQECFHLSMPLVSYQTPLGNFSEWGLGMRTSVHQWLQQWWLHIPHGNNDDENPRDFSEALPVS